jgi:hypothetical protein
VGALVTLKLPDQSSADLPWIVTFGPLDEYEDWEPVVCGPYERPHALALAEAVVADEELLAVVEPLLPRITPEEIRHEISEAQRQAVEDGVQEYGADDVGHAGPGPNGDGPTGPAGPAGSEGSAGSAGSEGDDSDEDGYGDAQTGPGADYGRPPDPAEVRAGFARIAARLTGPAD